MENSLSAVIEGVGGPGLKGGGGVVVTIPLVVWGGSGEREKNAFSSILVGGKKVVRHVAGKGTNPNYH